MGKKKDAIDKIDDQIQNILDEEKKIYHEENDEEGHEVIVEHKYDFDPIPSGDTKKINKIEEIEEDIEIEDEQVEHTEKIHSLEERIEKIEKEKEENEEKEKIVEKQLGEKKETKKNSNKKKYIVIAIVFFIILAILFVLLLLLPSRRKKVDIVVDDKLSKEEQQEVIDDYGKAIESILAVYSQKQNVLLEYEDAAKLIEFDYEVNCDVHEVYENGDIYLNECKINKKKTKASYGTKQKKEKIKVSEGAIKVYVNKENGKTVLKEPDNLKQYDVYSFDIDGSYADLAVLTEYNGNYVFYHDDQYIVHMINFKTGQKALSTIGYQDIIPIKRKNGYDANHVAVEINDKWGIYHLKSERAVVPVQYDTLSPLLQMGVSGPVLEIEPLEDDIIAGVRDSKYGVLHYEEDNIVIPFEYKTMLRSGSYLWAVDDDEVGHILDTSGNEYLKDDYEEVYGFVDGKYALIRDSEDSIKLIKLDGKVLYDYGKLELGKLNYFLGYNGALFSFEKPGAESYDDCFEITYDSTTKKGEAKDFTCGGIAKPILYLYPKKTTNVTVKFVHPEYLETTYPKYLNKWEVTAHSNGDLYDSNNHYYYALYWDEIKVHNVDFTSGYYVTREDAIDFLEQKLDYIGLTKKEKNEFIMYWLPVLEKNEKSIVYFELTEERESYNPLRIQPKPDSLLRLVIHIKKVDKKIDIPKQSLQKFQRKGFVAVEWGGTTY